MVFNVPGTTSLSGVYAIINHENGRRYIGSGKQLRKRYQNHFSALRRAKHRNHLLQADYLKFEPDLFSFVCLEECVADPTLLVALEQCYLDRFFDHQITCYNASPIATSSLKVRTRASSIEPMVSLTGETWRLIVGFPGYEVSNFGRVRSYRGQGRGGLRSAPRLRKLIPAKKRGGYLTVILMAHNKKHLRYAHHLVLEAFKGPCPPGQQARHVQDRDVTNNTVDNLEWGTSEDNMADKTQHGTSQHGERNHQCKLSDADAALIRASNAPGNELARRFGVSGPQISRIRHGVQRDR